MIYSRYNFLNIISFLLMESFEF